MFFFSAAEVLLFLSEVTNTFFLGYIIYYCLVQQNSSLLDQVCEKVMECPIMKNIFKMGPIKNNIFKTGHE